MDIESEIKQLKDEEQKAVGSDLTCWNCFGLVNKSPITFCGLCCLIFGLFLLTGSWASIWPIALAGMGAYLLLQTKESRA